MCNLIFAVVDLSLSWKTMSVMSNVVVSDASMRRMMSIFWFFIGQYAGVVEGQSVDRVGLFFCVEEG